MVEAGVRAMLMRGGTSKGLYLSSEDVPTETDARDEMLLRLLGSPDPRQIDGVGGAHPLTSKVAIVGLSERSDADVTYLFLQIGVEEATISDRQTCGNLLAGVGQFAVERGILAGGGAEASVRIHDANTGGIATATFPLDAAGFPLYEGSTAISGVPGTAAAVHLDFEGIAGGTCGSLLPTGAVRDTIEGVEVTCIDNGMPVVVLRAADLGVRGDAPCRALEEDHHLRQRLEALRLSAGRRMGLGDVSETTIPKMTMLAPPVGDADVATRTFIPHRCHQAIGVLGAVSVATACRLPGSVAADLVGVDAGPDVVLEHPSGTFTAHVELELREGYAPSVGRSGIVRTARKLFDGTVFPRPS